MIADPACATVAGVRLAVVDPSAYTPPYDHELCRALAARGLAVELLTAPFTHGDAPAAVGYTRREIFAAPASGLVRRWPRSPLRIPLKLAGHAGGLGRLVRQARTTHPDVVHWQWAPLPHLDRHAIRAAGRYAGATVFTAHDVLPRRSAGAVDLWRKIYGSCDRVIVHSRAGRDRLRDEVGVPESRIAVIPHALFTSLATAPANGRPSGDVVLFFGLIHPDKGLDTLIEALAHVPEARLEVVGSPRMPMEPLRERARSLGVDGRIAWNLRFVDDTELAAAFGRASVVALPYRAIEGSGVMATALAFGVPVVATAVGGFPELAVDYDLADPVPPGDPEALGAALERMLSDDALRARAQAGMGRARAELTWERVAEQTEELYRELLRS
jgi:glycosyltransferase involved in cell wall biosynthesis